MDTVGWVIVGAWALVVVAFIVVGLVALSIKQKMDVMNRAKARLQEKVDAMQELMQQLDAAHK